MDNLWVTLSNAEGLPMLLLADDVVTRGTNQEDLRIRKTHWTDHRSLRPIRANPVDGGATSSIVRL